MFTVQVTNVKSYLLHKLYNLNFSTLYMSGGAFLNLAKRYINTKSPTKHFGTIKQMTNIIYLMYYSRLELPFRASLSLL